MLDNLSTVPARSSEPTCLPAHPSTHRVWILAPFLFLSGLSALVYQVCWFREFRLVFGASTAASAAVLAIFIGGLGAGGIVIGRRADRHQQPLALYARLEMAIAVAAALSPLFLYFVRWAYLSVGGTTTLGLAGGTVIRLVLASLVLGVPTFLMGGTLPAVIRTVATEDDRGRRLVAWLYAINTLGAVAGSGLATFFLIEQYGTRQTLWLAASLNLVLGAGVAHLAWKHRALFRSQSSPPKTRADADDDVQTSPWFVLPAAAVVGFAFFLMEMVWYRMLSPILGGSVFTFGLILCFVLLGIGLGGLLSALAGRQSARLPGFALTCLLEAACVMAAYALGDRLAWLAVSLQSLSVYGFGGVVLGWSVVAGIAVIPAAVVAGYQFPLLIALLGKGKTDVGRHVGAAYAWNTAGAMLGSLAGGFLLLPLLSATGCWRMVGILLTALGVGAMVLWLVRTHKWLSAAGPLAMACLIVALTVMPDGPTAVWRHSGIGVGRVTFSRTPSANEYRAWAHSNRLWVTHEIEGVESCVGVESRNGLTFIVNGKADGSARGDAPTQVMLGLLGSMFHPDPRSAMVVGLGTGSTAGWLGAVPSIERVDVVELEPAVLEFAQLCAPVNAGAMTNPKVRIAIGDAREFLMTAPRRYDLVVSEPSNPYRAGIASLFTREYYQSVASRLEDRGVFVQWLQAYDIQSRTVQTVYATLLSVFPCVETWEAAGGDMLLIASRGPLDHDVARLRRLMTQEPYRTALLATWRSTDAEGFYAHYVANTAFARSFTQGPDVQLNTDDRTVIEFDFARSVNLATGFSVPHLRRTARSVGQHLPGCVNGSVDWDRAEEEAALFQVFEGNAPLPSVARSPEQQQRALALRKYAEGDYASALAAWRAQPKEPQGPVELAVVADAMASQGEETALKYIEQLRTYQPVEADVALARLRHRQGKLEQASASLVAAFTRFRDDPWPMRLTMRRALALAPHVAGDNKAVALELHAALRQPFAVSTHDEARRDFLMQLAGCAGDSGLLLEEVQRYEPFVPWNQGYLTTRLNAYLSAGHPLYERALAELAEYQKSQAEDLLAKMSPRPSGSPPPADHDKATASLEE
jgi:spermidine synthase